ncbi:MULTISPECIES: MaoC family dehydratase [unclassified Beijerinckia]|uniref:MaoC family dehydratase n=1 Tax=unclassified Beijerinckia TaxID=2638183 RepID=UPI00089B89CE|nr:MULTISPECIES: MaoC family dehydratase [unclassified Beijerinckia]MDH7793939.1 acyl dehydratase [Beijerinckia sp. GAS462]SEB49853.1 Acyl dehydratase [Beijerinckia sp. 28-YEA-48]
MKASTDNAVIEGVARLEALIGKVRVSPWLLIDQHRIDGFADVTEDHQFLHVDVEAAAKGPFGGTIAHGFLSLSLLSKMAKMAVPMEGASAVLNYGFDRVRFLTPVPSGSRIRGHFTLSQVSPRAAGQILLQYKVEVEIEGVVKPALSADWLMLFLYDSNEMA